VRGGGCECFLRIHGGCGDEDASKEEGVLALVNFELSGRKWQPTEMLAASQPLTCGSYVRFSGHSAHPWIRKLDAYLSQVYVFVNIPVTMHRTVWFGS
jgi:hypothetical protein